MGSPDRAPGPGLIRGASPMTAGMRRRAASLIALASLAFGPVTPPRTASLIALASLALDATALPPAVAAESPEPLFPILEQGGWGYIDARGTVVIPARYQSLVSVDLEWRVGQTLPRGQRPRPSDLFLSPAVQPESSAVLAVKHSGRWGFADRDGRLSIPPRFDQVGVFREGFAPVRVEERWGFVDARGRLAVDPRFQEVGDFRGGLAVVIEAGRCGVIDSAGRTVVRPRFERVVPGDSVFHGDRALIVLEGKKGYVRRDGTIAIPARFRNGGHFREGLAAVETAAGYGFIDSTGAWVIAPRFDGAAPFDRGLAWVLRAGVHGVIDRGGGFVVTPRFEEAGGFAGGEFAPVRRGRAFGWIDRSGTWIEAPGAEVERIDDTLRVVQMPAGGFAIIEVTRGQITARIDAERFEGYSEGLAAVSRRAAPIGFVDTDGQTRIAPRFDRVDRFRAGLCRVAAGDTLGYVDRNGRWAWHRLFPGQRQRRGAGGR